MNFFKKMSFIGLSIVVPMTLGTQAANAAPVKAERVVVGYAPGGATDVVARFLAMGLAEKQGKPVIVENKPGAGGTIGASQISRSKPDGSSLLVAYISEASINKLLYSKMPYDPEMDLVPIARIATAPLILASGPKMNVGSFKELLVAGKNGDTPLSYGSAGYGGQQHLAGELLRMQTGMNMLHVPYRGSALAVVDLLGGQIDVGFFSISPLLSHIEVGKIKPLFIAGPERQAFLPDVPTADEVGLKDFDLATWFGVFGPKGMTPEVAEGIAQDVKSLLEDKEAVKILTNQGLAVSYLPPKEFRSYIATEMKKYGDIVEKAGIEKQ